MHSLEGQVKSATQRAGMRVRGRKEREVGPCQVLEARELRGKSQSAQQEARMLIWGSRVNN